MPIRRYALGEGGPKRLELRWRWNWSDMIVTLDGQQIAGPFRKSELENQVTATLPDGSILGIVLATVSGYPELQVALDGKALPGSSGDPAVRLKNAWIAILFVAGFNLLIGIGLTVFHWDFLEELGDGTMSFVIGSLFLLLGFLVARYRSRVALGLAILLLGIDGVLILFMAVSSAGVTQFKGLFIRGVIIAILWQGFDAIRELETGK